jgi:hypothetical protein
MMIVRTHQPVNTGDAIVDVAERSRLFAVAPDLDFGVFGQLGERNFTAHRGRGLLASAVPRAERPKDVMKAHDACLEAVVFAIVGA